LITVDQFHDFSLLTSFGPEQVIRYLSSLFNTFDKTLKKYNLITKIKSFGESYICASGILSGDQQQEHHVEQALQFCLNAFQIVDELNEMDNLNFHIKIGISTSGSMTIGIIGDYLPTFEIIGKSIYVVSTLTNKGIPDQIHVCNITHHLLCKIQDFPNKYSVSVILNEESEPQSFFVQSQKQ
jgi:class 3 adenylate cyclase